MKATLVVLAVAAVLAQESVAQTPGYHLLGFPTGTNRSYATGVSADGRWVTGNGVFSPGSNPRSGFSWSEFAGRADFLTETNTLQWSQSNGISGNGFVTVGIAGFFGAGPGYDHRAFRRTGPGVYENLGLLSGFDESTATAANGDGSVVVGYNYFQSHRQDPSTTAFRWTPATGMQPLAFPFPQSDFQAVPNAISRDGSTIVGYGSGFTTTPAVWSGDGAVRTLPRLPGGASGQASGTNHNGSLIVGYSDAANGLMTAALWTNDVIQPLTAPAGWRSWATGVSDDGSVILGILSTSAVVVPSVWTPSSGSWVPLSDYLAGQGMPVPEGWTFSSIATPSMSADGRTFSATMVVPGQGTDPATLQAVAISVPSPAPTTVLVMGMMLCFQRRRS